MPSYSVLGTIDKTGQALLSILSQKKDIQVRAYIRSKKKLLALSPDLASSPSYIEIFEGPLQDVDLLARCMQGTKAVFMVVAESDNVPGCKIAQETAHVVIAALEQLRSEDPQAQMPRLVVLSAAPTALHLCRGMPRLVGYCQTAIGSGSGGEARNSERRWDIDNNYNGVPTPPGPVAYNMGF